jgi:hypothetical protein
MACPPTNVKFQLRRAIASNWTSTNPILQAGEPGFETDTYKLKIGDGVTRWNGLMYIDQTGSTGPQGIQGVTGPTTSYIFDGGNAQSTYFLGPAFDCGSAS